MHVSGFGKGRPVPSGRRSFKKSPGRVENVGRKRIVVPFESKTRDGGERKMIANAPQITTPQYRRCGVQYAHAEASMPDHRAIVAHPGPLLMVCKPLVRNVLIRREQTERRESVQTFPKGITNVVHHQYERSTSRGVVARKRDDRVSSLFCESLHIVEDDCSSPSHRFTVARSLDPCG